MPSFRSDTLAAHRANCTGNGLLAKAARLVLDNFDPEAKLNCDDTQITGQEHFDETEVGLLVQSAKRTDRTESDGHHFLFAARDQIAELEECIKGMFSLCPNDNLKLPQIEHPANFNPHCKPNPCHKPKC